MGLGVRPEGEDHLIDGSSRSPLKRRIMGSVRSRRRPINHPFLDKATVFGDRLGRAVPAQILLTAVDDDQAKIFGFEVAVGRDAAGHGVGS